MTKELEHIVAKQDGPFFLKNNRYILHYRFFMDLYVTVRLNCFGVVRDHV
jgi:hypothetical protein